MHNKGSSGYTSYREMKFRIDFLKISRKTNHSQTNHSGNKLMTGTDDKVQITKNCSTTPAVRECKSSKLHWDAMSVESLGGKH